ncbi:hypothetical protein HRI_001197400 [Hibiscus trionum]|uniref:Uncharacterized protein n=1 Tax=Hibiscus trionum TaxID=183268 RepID=A0A9W7HDQ0_HIBTR|nr:hypothetical protein HRI_001197400 [Hibiscus trionum]
MGNCFTSNKIVSQNDQDDPQSCSNDADEAIKEMGNVTVSNKEGAAEESGGVDMKKKKKKKKVVRFKLNEEDGVDDRSGKQGESKSGVVRIRLVVTQEELQQIILSSGKDLKQPSMEQLLKVVKLRGVRVSEGGRTSGDDGGDGGFHGGWRPALESIPEEH